MPAQWVFWNRIKETLTSHTGTGTFALEASAATGHERFTTRLSNNDKFLYLATNSDGSEWEVGTGTYITASDDVQRTTVHYSSNTDGLVNFSAGTITVELIGDSATLWRDPEFSTVQVHDDTAAAADVTTLLLNNDATDGDPNIAFQLSGTTQFLVGVDDSTTNDDLVIAASTQLGTTDRMSISGNDGTTWLTSLEVGTAAKGEGGTNRIVVYKNDTATTTPMFQIHQAGAGDPLMHFIANTGSPEQFFLGIDNSDGADPFVITDSTPIGHDNDPALSVFGIGTTGVKATPRLVVGDTTMNGAYELQVYASNTDTSNGMVVINQASTGDSSLQFAIQAGTQAYMLGIDNSTSDNDFVIADSASLGTTDRLAIDGGDGVVWMNQINCGPGSVRGSTMTDMGVYVVLSHTNTTAAAIQMDQDSTGDCFIEWQITLASNFSMGIDNSDSDKFVFTATSNLGSAKIFDVNEATQEVQFYETIGTDGEVDNGNSGTADTIDWGNGNHQKSTMTDDCTYTFTAPTVGTASLILKLIQGTAPPHNPTWPATVKWAGGTEPTWSTSLNDVDIIAFYYDGTNYHGSLAVKGSA